MIITPKTGGSRVTINHLEAVDLGRAVVTDGRLKQLRISLGLTRNAMADLLNTAFPTYVTWEGGKVHLRTKTAERVGRFYSVAVLELDVLKDHGVSVNDLVPFHHVATLLGIPQEQLLYRYRNGEFAAIDIGILGLWVAKSELAQLRKQ